MYDTIVVPTDGSPAMQRVIEHALDHAATHGSTVHAVYVVDTTGMVGFPMEAAWQGIDEMLRKDAHEAVTAIERAAAERDVDIETRVLEGTPNREIVRYAERRDCDLIVMGTHGRGGIDRLLLGSVAEQVVRSSSVPVLTVRVSEETPADPVQV